MPKTKIVHNDRVTNSADILKMLIDKNLVSHCSCLGTDVYGRYYLSKDKLRKAYYHQLPKVRSKRAAKIHSNIEEHQGAIYEERKVLYIDGVPQIPNR